MSGRSAVVASDPLDAPDPGLGIGLGALVDGPRDGGFGHRVAHESAFGALCARIFSVLVRETLAPQPLQVA